MDTVTYPCRDLSKKMLVKGTSGVVTMLVNIGAADALVLEHQTTSIQITHLMNKRRTQTVSQTLLASYQVTL